MMGTLMHVDTATAAIGTSFCATVPVDSFASLPNPTAATKLPAVAAAYACSERVRTSGPSRVAFRFE